MNAIVKIEMPNAADLAGGIIHLASIATRLIQALGVDRQPVDGMPAFRCFIDHAELADLNWIMAEIGARAGQIETWAGRAAPCPAGLEIRYPK